MWISKISGLAWVLIIVGIVLTPFIIGIFIFAIGLYLLFFRKKLVMQCAACHQFES